jgi:hypothetical protein
LTAIWGGFARLSTSFKRSRAFTGLDM